MMRVVWIALLCLATLGGCANLDESQRRWIFQPSREAWRGGDDASAGMEPVWIEFQSQVNNEPTKLHALWLGQPRADAPVMLFLHGARWDIRGSAHRMRRMHELGFAVLGIDYRGFGKSSDTLPSEAKAYEDAQQAWAWLARHHPLPPRYIFGHSLGGAIAVQLAASVSDEAGLIVEGTFTSVADVLASYRWGWLPIGVLLTQRFESARRIAEVGVPVLVVHGEADRVILPKLGQALFEQAREPKRFELVPGASHHNTNSLGVEQYRRALNELFGLTPTQQAKLP